MYSPPFYRENRDDLIRDVIRENPFATLLTAGAGGLISHLPLLLEGTAESPEIRGHMARANPHWKELSGGRAKALFHGPHAYISPAWYVPAPGIVPTWNYAVVHVTGRFEIIDRPGESFAAMDTMVRRFESANGTDWRLPAGDARIEDDLMNGIVVFKLTGLEFEAKFKLSQRQDAVDRDNVIRELEARGEKILAEQMRRTKAP